MRTLARCIVSALTPFLALSASAGLVKPHEAMSPLVPVAPLAGRGAASAALSLRIDAESVAELGRYSEPPAIILPIGNQGSVLVELTRMDVLTADARVVVVTNAGEVEQARPAIQLWRGKVLGDSESRVFLGLSSGEANGWITTNGKTYWITTAKQGDGMKTVTYDSSLLPELAGQGFTFPQCAGGIIPPGVEIPEATGLDGDGSGGPRGVTCRVFNVAADSDQELLTLRGGDVQATIDYITLILAAAGEIYDRDLGFGLRVSFLRVWSTTDPWTATTTSTQLPEFQNYWQVNQTGVTRSVAHMFSGKPSGGGIAYVRSMCNSNAYGVSANLITQGGLFPYPITDNAPGNSNWDLMVVSHEIGHNMGTGHTHCNTEYSPVIDGCGLSNATGTPSCQVGTQDCSVATAKNGTIMSYCHLCSGGVSNMKMVFGSRVASRMQSFLAGQSACGVVSAPATLSSITASPGAASCPGTAVTLSANASGTNLTFQWARNGAPISGATGPTFAIASLDLGTTGTYGVTVRNGCAFVNSATSGQNIALTIAIPGDFDGDGFRNPGDIFLFLNAYFAGSPSGDFNGDGVRTPTDIFAFLNAYFSPAC